MMMSVLRLTNWSACIENEIVMPRSSVMRFAKSFCAVWERRSKQPHSRSRLPNIRKPTSETDIGAMKPAMIVTMMGTQMRSERETCLGLYGMCIARSFFVVTSLMANGWMIGTSAMYE